MGSTLARHVAARGAAGRRTGGGTETTSVRVERADEGVLVLQALEHRLGAHAAGERVREWTADALQKRGPQEQVAHLRRLTLEDLGEQVTRNGALAAGELRHEPLWVGVCGQRDRRQPQARRPSLRAFVQRAKRLASERAIPPALSSARVSSREKRRSAPRSSVSSPASRRRCRPSAGPRASPARPGPAGASWPSRSLQPRERSLESSSCRSSITSTTGSSLRAAPADAPPPPPRRSSAPG